MILLGSIVNGGAVVVGGLVGMFVGKLLPERLRTSVMAALSLMTIGIAVPGLLKSNNALIPIISMVVGTLIGELLDMARRTVQHQRTDVLAERRKQILLSHEAEVKIHKRPWMICVLIQIGIVIDRIAGFLLIPIGGNRLQKMAHYQLVLIGLYRCLYRTIHSSFSYTFFLCLRFFYFFARILVSPCSHVFSADCIFTKPT